MSEDPFDLERMIDMTPEEREAFQAWRDQHYFTLDADGNPVSCRSVMKWARWLEESSRDGTRIIAQDQVGPWTVSTVFLGLNHSFLGIGPPVLWETMIFSQLGEQDTLDTELRRYTTKDDAIDGHARWVAQLRAGEVPSQDDDDEDHL